VHVWRVDLSTVEDELAQLLSNAERGRAERFVRPRERALWMCSRGVLRELLGRYLQTDPSELRFAIGAHGKPSLLGDCAGSISFNLSHSRGLALYAFAATGEVGVDVQMARGANAGRAVDRTALARRVFGSAHARRLQALAPDSREREFLRLWTRREAEAKCRGTGIARDPWRPASELWVTELEVEPPAAAALASTRAPREWRCWDWG
jgi:4'-phosphopantetheinyl transferase